MAKLTIVIGVLLIAVGAVGFFGTGSMFPMSLIPAYFGAALVIFGALALTENAKKRMLWMHIAVTVGLIGLIGGGIRFFQSLHGPMPAETEATGAMALLCLIFVVLCIRSFIAARRSRIQ
jgi:hypothetical protein